MSYKSYIYIFLTFIGALQSPLLRADDIASQKFETIKALHARGVALYEQQQYAEAAHVYREMLTVKRDYQYYYYVGECEYMRQRYDLAVEAFSVFLENTGDEVAKEAREHAEDVVAEVTANIGYISVPEENEFEVWVDNEHRGTTPQKKDTVVLPGEHTVSFISNGETVYTTEISITQGQTVEVIRPEPEPEPSLRAAQPAELLTEEPTSKELTTKQSADSEPAKKQSPLTTTGLLLAGIGGATLAASLVTGKLALSKSNQLKDNCDNQKDCDESNRDMFESAESLAKATNVLLVTGTALALTGVIIAITGHKKSTANEKLSVQTAPVIGQSLLGIFVHGSF